MKNSILIIGIFLIVKLNFAQVTQEWVRTYNGPGNNNDGAQAIACDGSGNVYVTGWSRSGSTEASEDFVTIKYDSLGIEQWVARYNGGSRDQALAIVVDDAGNVYVTGKSVGTTSFDYATVKYNSSGAQQWAQRYGGPGGIDDVASSITLDRLGNVYVTGYSWGNGSLDDFATIKYSSTGIQRWVARYNGPANRSDRSRAVAVDRMGNVFVTGFTTTTALTYDIATVKYDSSGLQLWSSTYNAPNDKNDQAYAIALDSIGNSYVCGSSMQSGTTYDYALLKYNSSGTRLWISTYNGTSNDNDESISLAIDREGNSYITGTSSESVTGWDCTTIKYSAEGAQQWIQKYNGPGSGSDLGLRIVIDDSSNVYVTGYGYSGTDSGNDYSTIKYNALGGQQWVMRYSGQGAQNDYATAIAVDNSGNTYVSGQSVNPSVTNIDIATIKYKVISAAIVITHPALNEMVLADDPFAIHWQSNGSNSFRIEFSADSGQTYNAIVNNTPAITNYYVWNVPDTLSTKCIIRITDILDTTKNALSGLFKIKGYLITKINNDGNYEKFEAGKHGWRFINANNSMWPSFWWSEFNYATGTDPYTNSPYPDFFHSFPSSTFPDWPLWVKVFSESQCYLGSDKVYRGKALLKWKVISNITFQGSCFGFAASSFLAFNYKEQFLAKHPGIPSFTNLYDLLMNDDIRNTINGDYLLQFGKQSYDNDVICKPKDPRTTLQELKDMFLSDDPNIRTISIFNNNGNGGGAHTIAPIRLEDGYYLSTYKLFLYNSNNPGDETGYILIDSTNNTWTEQIGLGYTPGSSHFYLEIPVSNYLNTPFLSKMNSDIVKKSQGIDYIELCNTGKANVIYTSSNGNRIGLIDSTILNEIVGGMPIISKTGYPSDPIGYYVPDDSYSMVMNNISDPTGKVYLTAFKKNVSYDYQRDNANSSQIDRFKIDDGFSVASQDSNEKIINLEVIAEIDSTERIMFVKETQLRQNDSLYLQEINQSDFVIKNYGTEKTYNLVLDERSAQGQKVFEYLSITLNANSTHTLLPNWDNLNQSFLKILIDSGNDGTIDDSLFLVNQLTSFDDHYTPGVNPTSYNLAQNYPNPFNPITNIQYQVSSNTQVSLKVYDVLGNEVATLVNEEQPAGSYKVNFDATGLSSGIYFYKLQAGSFIETKKMILLR